MTDAQLYTLVLVGFAVLIGALQLWTAFLNRQTSRETNAITKATEAKVNHITIQVDGQLTEWKRALEENAALKIIAAQMTGRSEGMEKERATPMIPMRDVHAVLPKPEKVEVVNVEPIPVVQKKTP